MKFLIMDKINEIIDQKCHKVPNSSLIQYTDTYTWIPKKNEKPHQGFKRKYPLEYEEECNDIFDIIHPY